MSLPGIIRNGVLTVDNILTEEVHCEGQDEHAEGRDKPVHDSFLVFLQIKDREGEIQNMLHSSRRSSAHQMDIDISPENVQLCARIGDRSSR